MSKPTHILVPIDKMEEISKRFGKDWEAIESHREDLLLTSPKVDLSEEGMNNKATAYALEQGLDYLHVCAYKQCAKDLLNTKP